MRLLVAAFLICVLVPRSFAESISYDIAIQNSVGSVPKFDPNLGTLTGIGYSGDLNFSAGYTVDNPTQNHTTWTGVPYLSIGHSFFLGGPTISGMSTIQSTSVGLGGAWNLSGVIPLDDMPPGFFVGTDSLDVLSNWNVSYVNSYSVTPGRTAGSGDLTVTYAYSTPEPSSIIMVAVAFGVIVPFYLCKR